MELAWKLAEEIAADQGRFCGFCLEFERRRVSQWEAVALSASHDALAGEHQNPCRAIVLAWLRFDDARKVT
jgi:hypothetical protein